MTMTGQDDLAAAMPATLAIHRAAFESTYRTPCLLSDSELLAAVASGGALSDCLLRVRRQNDRKATAD